MSEPLVSIADARARILETSGGRLGEERVPVATALHRVLAGAVAAAGDSPPFPCSAMDGYALGSGPTPGRFTQIGESRAGAPYRGAELSPGQAVRISTGAAVPAGTVAVVRQEDTAESGEGLDVRAVVADAANIRATGEDMRAGEVVLQAGIRVGAAELGAAVAAGAGVLLVARRPVVVVLCTGDELRAPGEPLEPGEIHNSNQPMLEALAVLAGAALAPGGLVGDDPEQTATALASALEACDLLIVCGGVSVGPHDHVRPALERLGVERHFWGVALAPGKPTWFGSRGRQLVFALPGNPVSAAVTFALFVAPALDALLGVAPVRPILNEARLGTVVGRNPARDQAIRVTLEQRDGRLVAFPAGRQASHLITSLVRADALAIIPRGPGTLAAGATVALEPLPGTVARSRSEATRQNR